MKKILVTGGAGYIGSHSCVELLVAGYEVVVVDNLSNSDTLALERVEQITGRNVELRQADIRDQAQLDQLFSDHDFSAVIHFAESDFAGIESQNSIPFSSCPLISSPRMLLACSCTSSTVPANLTPPALPRPPVCTWAGTRCE